MTTETDPLQTVRSWYESSYGAGGLSAQRRYPNEELCRFMGRHFFSKPPAHRSAIRILEAGCGSGANLWMLAREGFDAHGIDISEQSIALARQMLDLHGCTAHLQIGDMTELPYPDCHFDAVVDVFSSYCLNSAGGNRFLASVRRVLKPGGLFFSYFPAKISDAYTDRGSASLLDANTLAGIERADSPFTGNRYPFRFMHPQEYACSLEAAGFGVLYNEIVSRTYNDRHESFSFITIEGRAN